MMMCGLIARSARHARGMVGGRTRRLFRRLFTELNLADAATVVSCSPVWRLHARRLRGVRAARTPVLIPDGERAKTLATVARIYDALSRGGWIDRPHLLAFGGGVVGDVAGFAAASYLRGIPLVQIPTTVLAQVDSAIGGKVGVNLPKGKNLSAHGFIQRRWSSAIRRCWRHSARASFDRDSTRS